MHSLISSLASCSSCDFVVLILKFYNSTAQQTLASRWPIDYAVAHSRSKVAYVLQRISV